MTYSFTFNGIRKNFVFCDDEGKTEQIFASLTRNFLKVPGMPGAHLESTDTEVRVIKQPIFFQGIDDADLLKKEEELAQWLVTEKAVPLIFDKYPTRTYFAVVSGTLDIQEMLRIGEGEITFICPDPYKYGPLKTNPPIIDLAAPVVLRNDGTVDAKPNIKVTLKQPTTYLDIIGENDYMRIGRPVDIDKAAVAEKETILHDTMSTLTGWGDAANTDIDGGVVTGTMASDGAKFYASSFGTGTSWHGPAKIKSLGQELADFEVALQPILDNDDLSKVGRIELYLLDVNKKAVAKLAIKDISKGQGGNIVEIRVGDNVVNTFLINEYGTNWNTWHDFNGLLQLTNKGNKWTAYVCKFINGQADQRTARKLVEWTDLNNQFTSKVAHVVVHIGANGTSTPSQMSIQDLKVFNLNQLSESQIPYIGLEGDVFEFDYARSVILKNGEFFYKKDFGARFFGLRPGDNPVVFSPPEVIGKVEAEWSPPYR
ncbi:phage tail family protein [Mesobacillus subterraneus]|uniref:distal tail protein Dit n=1 Tax=Mesobacillus subterraneus TaxID=285983 RepID=UPI00273F619A|nr:distal tail protein Dit [Mesobacillus subterraneus]WLR54283.1 phage tail family protein [Mesobacillus subterraneus]